ncbi:hypothetical protein [Halorussus aquaticus]|uniref:Uncharacterized protein n=1 Tax=Halorussus aquaticus TaxID=2953748 RepID=A0ABD5PXQ9_9EURY|nr:hypothetical protein [Halorussus aquaticus]
MFRELLFEALPVRTAAAWPDAGLTNGLPGVRARRRWVVPGRDPETVHRVVPPMFTTTPVA